MKPERIKRLLKQRGIHQREIARKCGVSDTHVSKVIWGSSVSRRVSEAIAAAIGKPLADVFPAYRPKNRAAGLN